MATYDGEVIFFKDNGEDLGKKLFVPRLRVRKNWYVGLNPDHVDHSHPDIHDPNLAREVRLSIALAAESCCVKREGSANRAEDLSGRRRSRTQSSGYLNTSLVPYPSQRQPH